MNTGFWFWLIYILCLIFGGVGYFQSTDRKWHGAGFSLALYVLLFLVGWKLFGLPIQGN